MAPDPITAERAYRSLRTDLLSGLFAPGSRIEAQPRADRHGTSVTPVREAMHRLVGEGLLEAEPHGGFRMPTIREAELRDLYGWNAQLALLAMRSPSDTPSAALQDIAERADPSMPSHKIVTMTATLFATIANRAGNREHRRAIDMLNDRLRAIRLAESRLVKDAHAELRNLARVVVHCGNRTIKRSILTYHRRRIDRVAEVIGGLYQNAGSADDPEK